MQKVFWLHIMHWGLAAFLLLGGYSGNPGNNVSKQLDVAASQITKQGLKKTVEALTDHALRGRENGTEQMELAQSIIVNSFIDGNIPMNGEAYKYGFYYWKGNERALGINIVGVIPADPSADSPRTIVIGAHYDHLGVLAGHIYPGADNNASGVAALAEIGKAFGYLHKEGIKPKHNIALVAFDCKENSALGSKYFLRDEVIKPSEISMMINLDQIGTTLAPPKEAQTDGLLPNNYMLFLGIDSATEDIRKAFVKASQYEKPMVLDFTFYGNQHVHDMLNEIGDQVSFRNAGIPAISVTSGIHKYTNKTTDSPSIINYNALTERSRLIFRAVAILAGLVEQD